MKRLKRLLARLRARLGGYFWLPCPICGQHFGGHEWRVSLYESWTTGTGVCPRCENEAKRRNAAWFAANPHPPIMLAQPSATTEQPNAPDTPENHAK